VDKEGRRRKRKEKRLQRARQRRASDPSDSVREELLYLYSEAKKEFIGLAEIVEIEADANVSKDDLLKQHGLAERYKMQSFETIQDDGYDAFVPPSEGDLALGGHTQLVADQDGCDRVIVFMHRSSELPLASDTWNIALFLHELGHVADFQTGTNLVKGNAIDLEAAELYAHEFACRRLLAKGFKQPLRLYINSAIEQLTRAPVQSMAEAAQRFKQSALYADCRAFLNA
jgi:hypothetical protein